MEYVMMLPYPKKFLLILAAILCIICPYSVRAQDLFHKGVNLTGWFQSESVRQIQFSKFTREDLVRIKGLGCDVIRLPINLHSMTNGAPDYTIDPLFYNFLDKVVDWSEELNLYLILDNHTFDPILPTSPDIGPILTKVWKQMAAHYKDRSELICYEVLNEPHGISDALWSSIQLSAIEAIRTEDTFHYIVVGGSEYNSYNKLQTIPEYSDQKLIYTFHFYDPFVFTHQGSDWGEPSMATLAGVPFPYQSANMPAVPNALKGTWVEDAMRGYPNDGTVAKVRELIDIAVTFRDQRQVPVFCGEMGVYIPNSDNTQRVAWYKEVRTYFEEKNLPWTMWDYTGGFGLFEKNSNELFDYDLNVPLLEALAFTVPEQSEYSQQFQKTGLILYDDYIGHGILQSGSADGGIIDYYHNTAPFGGDYSLYWSGVAQYAAIGFDFKPNVNFNLLPEDDFKIEFMVKGNTPGVSFDIRFIDTKTSDTDHPWRMGKTIDETYAPWDGEWHLVSIPLKDLEEKGSWDNAWYPPEGKFNWGAVDLFEINAESQALTGVEFEFDNIQISGENIEIVTSTDEPPLSFGLTVFPNPVNQQMTITFSVPSNQDVSVDLLSLMGRHIKPLYKGTPQGESTRIDYPVDLPAGIYLVQLCSGGCLETRKVLVK